MIFRLIDALAAYGVEKGLIGKNEVIYTRNRLLDVLREDGYEAGEELTGLTLSVISALLSFFVYDWLLTSVFTYVV